MIDTWTLLTILAMASVTYLTRIIGFLALRNRRLGPRATAVLEAVPGAVLIAVIAPAFTSTRLADQLALALTILAATRFSMLPTVLVGVGSAGLLRYLL